MDIPSQAKAINFECLQKGGGLLFEIHFAINRKERPPFVMKCLGAQGHTKRLVPQIYTIRK